MKRPNILLLFTDQQRYDTIHAAGNPIIKTPNLDRLVNEGVLFSNSFTASPVCVSARCSLIHGQYAHNTGCTHNGEPMPYDRPSFMQCLTEAGYRTHGIGKMHFMPDAQALRGFQSREHSEEIRSKDDAPFDDYMRFLADNGYDHVYDIMGPRGEMYYLPQPAQMPARFHNTNWVGMRSEKFIREQKGDHPWMLFSSYIHPHPPFSPPTPWNKLYRAALMPLPKRPPDSAFLHTWINRFQNRYKYRDAGIDDNLLRCQKAYYYACISFIDYQVGRLLTALEETGQLDNTLILYTSDHGEFLGDYNCFGKRSMLDSACRTPLVLRDPERVASGETCTSAASIVDVMPTFLTAAGVDTSGLALDGLDLAKLAKNDNPGRTVYSQFQRRDRAIYMAANQETKYIYSTADRQEYLFDRIQDPDELRSRAGLVFCSQKRDEMRSNLWNTLQRDGHTDGVTTEGWRKYPVPQEKAGHDPDAGLLIQDPGWAQEYQPIEGYTD